LAQQGGERPQRLIGFEEPPRARPRRVGWAMAAALLAIAALGLAAMLQQLVQLNGEVQRLAAVLDAAHRAAERAGAADTRAIDLLARAGASAAPAGGALLARERAFVTVERVELKRRGRTWRAVVVARNDGATPTRDLRYAADADPAPPAAAKGLLIDADAAAQRLAPAAIAAHAGIALPGPALGPGDRGRTLYLYGVIYYKDVLSDMQHVTQYCWYATVPDRLTARRRPPFQPCVHLNCADRECYAGSGR
jgi:hypothetical protein